VNGINALYHYLNTIIKFGNSGPNVLSGPQPEKIMVKGEGANKPARQLRCAGDQGII